MAGTNQPHEPKPSPAVITTVGQDDGYYKRKADGRCTRGRCPREAAPDSQLCPRHLKRKRRLDRESAKRRRDREREAGRCACGCGLKSATWLAPGCAIRLRRVPRAAVGPTVGHGAGGVWRDDANGWRRFRGRGKRGAPPAGANDAFELKTIVDAIERGKEALAYARSPDVAQQGRITQQGAKNAAADWYALAARGLDDLVDRLRKGR